MKVPGGIKKAIMDCANFNSKAVANEKRVYEWLRKHNLTEETTTDVHRWLDDEFIDSCKIGYDPQYFIEKIESLEEE